MGITKYFGLSKFGSEGRISDDNYKHTLRDREFLDSLLYYLATHDHRAISDSVLNGGPDARPTLTFSNSSGALSSNTTYRYRISYIDGVGNETLASTSNSYTTPSAIGSPPVMQLDTASTGGFLEAGTYRYALSYYQDGGGESTANNTNSIIVPIGTSTNTVTVTLNTLPDGADGWKIYRRSTLDDDYYYLDSVASGATEYVDDGATLPDCTKKRPVYNSTNSFNSITIGIDPTDLPLPSWVTGWRVYRTTGVEFGEFSLLATIYETTTEGGSDLVTSYTDAGGSTYQGSPVNVSTEIPKIPQLDAGDVFDVSGKPLPAELSPRGVRQLYTFAPTVSNDTIVNQLYVPHDMYAERLDVFFLTAPSGVDSSNYVVIKVGDDALIDEVQSVFNNSHTDNEIQYLYNSATAGTFTISWNGFGPSAPIAYNSDTLALETAVEDLDASIDVQVAGIGTASSPWVIEFLSPGDQDVPQITTNDSGLTGGTSTIFTSIPGSDGGTFTLSIAGSSTPAIAYNASAATLATALREIQAISSVVVAGSGTEADPWVITFTDGGVDRTRVEKETVFPVFPQLADGSSPLDIKVGVVHEFDRATPVFEGFTVKKDFPLLVADDNNLNGFTTVTEVTRGVIAESVQVVCDTADQYHFWQSPVTDEGIQQAQSAPATGGTAVSDTWATDDYAAELDSDQETNSWNVGPLDVGEYIAKFYVADVDGSGAWYCQIVDLNGPTVLFEQRFANGPTNPSLYVVYELPFTTDGVHDLEFRVVKDGATADRVRVDKYEYEADLPRFYEGQMLTVSTHVVGTPSGNGSDVQINLWY